MQILGALLFNLLRPLDARRLVDETHPVDLPEQGGCRRRQDVLPMGFSASRSIGGVFARDEGVEASFGGHQNLAEETQDYFGSCFAYAMVTWPGGFLEQPLFRCAL